MIITTSDFSADFLLQKSEIWANIIPHKLAQKDAPWFKVVAHGIPTSDFNNPSGMQLIVDEIKTFNKGFTPIGTPYWLTSASNRQNQLAGSVAIAFATEEEAKRAIKNRLYIAGISVRVEKLYTTAPSTQCTKCQGFGHLDSYCKKTPKCALCSEDHATIQHYCTSCKTKGKKCIHLAPNCANCKQAHTATDKCCEVYLAAKTRTNATISYD